MTKGDASAIKIALIVVASAALYLLGNGAVSLWDRDEPRYAMTSRWMAQSGDWVVPRIGWGDEPNTYRTAKPVFIYWCQAATMKLLGPTVFAARLPSAIAMTFTLAIVALVVRRYVSPRHALWNVLILASSAIVIATAKMCVTDSVLLLWITISQLCLIAIYRGNRSPLVAVLMWAAIGVGGLTKGPVSLGVPFTTMLVLAALDVGNDWRSWRAWRSALRCWRHTRPLLGLAILIAVVGPWLYLVQQRTPGLLARMIGHDVLERARTGLEGHSFPPGFYLFTIFATFFPWSLLLPMALTIAWRSRSRPEIRFALAAVIGPWIMMELISTKLVHYVLPIFPPLAFLVADAAIQCFEAKYNDFTNKAASAGALLWGVIFLALASMPWLAMRNFPDLPIPAVVALSAIGLACAILVYIAFANRRAAYALAVIGLGFMTFCAILFGEFFPHAPFLHLSPKLASVLIDHGANTRGDVRMIGYKEQSLAFYQGGTIDEAADNVLVKTPVERWPRWIVATSDIVDSLPPERRLHLEMIAQFAGINYAKSAKVIQVLVIRNRN